MTKTKKESTPAGAPSENQVEDTIYSILASILSKATRENPVTRGELSAVVSGRTKAVRDRQVRRYIHDMRIKGAPICSSANGKGYWIANNQAELLEFIKEYTHYAMEIYRTAAAMQSAMEMDGQIAMERS